MDLAALLHYGIHLGQEQPPQLHYLLPLLLAQPQGTLQQETQGVRRQSSRP